MPKGEHAERATQNKSNRKKRQNKKRKKVIRARMNRRKRGLKLTSHRLTARQRPLGGYVHVRASQIQRENIIYNKEERQGNI